MKTVNLLLIAGILVLVNSCREDYYKYDCRTSYSCDTCKRFVYDSYYQDCNCVNDSVNFHCPSGVVHSTYDFSLCNCRCNYGWTGTLCDQNDTNYYISFRFGTDTLALSEPIRTSSYSFFDLNFRFFDFAGSLPGSEIDTINLTDLPLLVYSIPFLAYSYPLCTDDDTCALLEVILRSGETANAVSGFYTVDTFGVSHGTVGGTFRANLLTNTGKSFFMRDGKYFLALGK